ncbi:MAG: RagB/SusD family nutrient uptake outer membrane protein [Prevotellaceae bacterium]|nr:RagB/SusD family nutrient uptake outer membrane protein [Prevotellaceae bacterium]
MKILKKSYIFAMALTVASMSSCSDWLDYNPKDKTTAEQQFSTRDGYYSAVNGVYNRLTTSTLYGSNLTYGAIDLMAKRYEPGSSTTTTRYYWANNRYIYLDSELGAIWKAAYQDILNINVILKNLTEQNGRVLNNIDHNLIKGDLLALRAFLHFDMLRLFGTVYSRDAETPVIPYNNTAEAQAYALKSSKDIVYNCLLPDLEEAEKCLKDVDPVLQSGANATNNENGDNYRNYRQLRMNYYAVALLKARVYQWAGDNDNALAEARKITDDSKVKEFFPFVNSDKLLGNTVNPDRVFSTEVLFGFYDAARDNIFTSYFDGANLSALTVYQPRLSYLETLFTNQGDYRYQTWWKRNGSYYNFIKYKEITYDKDDVPMYALLMPLMRVSEAYYIAAEALAAQANATDAANYLNTVLDARGETLLDPETATVIDVANELKLEYMREFWGEGQIFFMFKRRYMTIGKELNAAANASVSASASIYVLPLPSNEQENR